MSKKDLSERDICSRFIYPALLKAGWDQNTQIREEVTFTDGRIFVKGIQKALEYARILNIPSVYKGIKTIEELS